LYLALSEVPGMSVQWSGNPWSRSHSSGVSLLISFPTRTGCTLFRE